jgi:hypothetical protein
VHAAGSAQEQQLPNGWPWLCEQHASHYDGGDETVVHDGLQDRQSNTSNCSQQVQQQQQQTSSKAYASIVLPSRRHSQRDQTYNRRPRTLFKAEESRCKLLCRVSSAGNCSMLHPPCHTQQPGAAPRPDTSEGTACSA